MLLGLLGVALILAAFRVDTPMLSGGNPDTWHGWMHGIAFLLIIATGVLAPLTMALAVRGDPSWRPIGVVSVAASALFVVFLILPWGNASFLMAIVTLFAWIAHLPHASRPITGKRSVLAFDRDDLVCGVPLGGWPRHPDLDGCIGTTACA